MTLIKNYERPVPENPYKGAIDELIDAGEGAAYQIVAPTKRVEGKRGTIASEQLKFQEAARDAGYTARQMESEDMEDGNTRRVFILTDKRSHTKRDKSAKDAPEVASK